MTRISPLWPLALALLLGMATACRPFVLSGFDVAPGDLGDARIMVFLLESGLRALLAGHSPVSPPMFWPVPGTLGYSDAHLLWVVPYGVLRGLGLGEIRAFSAMVCLALAWGCGTCWWLFRRALGLDGRAAAVGAYLFAFGAPMQMKLNHAQMIGVCLLPSVLLLLHAGWAGRRAMLAAAAGLLTGLLFATSYVASWFFLFFGLLAVLAGVVLAPGFRAALATGRLWRVAGGFALGLLLGLLPFMAIYGHEILHGVRRGPGEANYWRPILSDLVNLGSQNRVWSPLLRLVGVPGGDPGSLAEREMGVSPPVWLLAAGGLWLLWRGRREWPLAALRMAALGAAVGTLMEFRYGRGLWAWMAAYLLVPGAAAIRNPFRSQLVAMLPLAGLVAVALEAALRRSRWLAAGLAGVAVLGAVGARPPANWRASEQAAALADVPAPPAGCRAFALAPQPAGGEPWWQMQSDALMLALHWRLPTLNGNSSWTPPGWVLGRPDAPGYAVAVREWVGRYGLSGVCSYSVGRRKWE